MVWVRTIWGIHMEWDDATSPQNTKDIAIGCVRRHLGLRTRMQQKHMLRHSHDN